MTNPSEYEERAEDAERQADRALTGEMAERWRGIAREYRDIAEAWRRLSRRSPLTAQALSIGHGRMPTTYRPE